MSRPRPATVAASIAVVALIGLLVWDLGFRLFLDLTVAGLSQGGVLALSGLGLVLTFRATGVLNFAHGAIGMFVAYVLWQLVQQWGWPVAIAAPIAIAGVGPGIGVLLDLGVFRPLERRHASMAEKLVATLGVFVLLVGLATVLWTAQTRTDPVALFPNRSIELFGTGVSAGIDQITTLLLAVGLTGLLLVVLRSTQLGRNMRAVVDRRELAGLAGVNANRVGAIAWALGAGLAGITGVLLAPVTFGLDPFRLTLLVIETFAVAVIARLSSFPLAIAGGLALGLLSSYQRSISFGRLAEALGVSDDGAVTVANLLDPVLVNLPVFILLGALLLHRSFAESVDPPRVARVVTGSLQPGTKATFAMSAVVALIALPWLIEGASAFGDAHSMLALGVVFISIVTVTGYSGHITLMQAAIAGMGAFFTGRIATGTFLDLPGMPIVVAMLLGALACVPVGLAAAYPALRRRGLFLGLTTLAFGLVVERYVFNSFYLNPGPTTTAIGTPNLLGLDLGGARAFYYYELVVLVAVAGLARRIATSRVGLTLAAIRDSEAGAESVGVDVRRYKLLAFSLGAFMAGLGGSLLGQRAGGFDGASFITFNSLLWFAVVVVAGVTTISGALLAAFIFTMLGTLVGDAGVSILVVGFGAVSMGYAGGGLVDVVTRALAGGRRKGPSPWSSTYAGDGPAPAPTSAAVRIAGAARRAGWSPMEQQEGPR